jgi:hypothetical protein
LPGEIPGILNICRDRDPWHAVPSTVMPLPSRSTSAGPPVVLDTALHAYRIDASDLRLDGSQANKASNRNENNREKNTKRQLYLINVHSSVSKCGATLPS